METDTQAGLPWQQWNIPRSAGLVVIVGGCAVLVGWALDIAILKQPLPAGVPMKANTAVAFVLSGFALRAAAARSRAAPILGIVVTLIGFLTASQDVLGWTLGIDELLVEDLKELPNAPPGRMAFTTALSFLALGLTFVAAPRKTWLTQPPALVTAFLSALAVVGYIYDVEALYGVSPFTAMAVHTAVFMLVLSVGVLWRNPAGSVMTVIRAGGLGGSAARRLLMIAMTVPVVLGWIALQGERAGLYEPEFGLALTVVSTITVLAVLIWSSAKSIEDLDSARQRVTQELSRLTGSLEERIAQQTADLTLREAQLRLVTETAHDAFIAIDANGRIVDWNPQAERTFGWLRSEVIGLPVSDVIVPAQYREAHARGLSRFLATGEGPMLNRRVKLNARHRDGHELRVELTIAPVHVNRAWRFNAFIRDLRERGAVDRPE